MNIEPVNKALWMRLAQMLRRVFADQQQELPPESRLETQLSKTFALRCLILFTGFFMWSYTINAYFIFSVPDVFFIGLISSLLHTSSWWIYNRTQSLVLSIYLAATGGWLFIVGFSWYGDGFYSISLTWAAALPLIVGVVTNQVHTLVWMGISFVSIVAMYFAHEALLPHQVYLLEEGRNFERFAIGLGMTLLVGSFTIFLLAMHSHFRRQLAQKNQQVRNLLRTLSHDISSPLSVIELSANALVEDSPSIHASRIAKTAGVISQILQQVRQFDAVDSGVLTLNLVPCSLSEVMAECLDLYVVRIEEKKLVVDSEIEPGLMVNLDRDMFSVQIIGNVLTNAVKFSSPGGRIVIRGYRGESGVHLKIRDFGVGIERGRLANLRRGIQLESTTGTQKETGTGFGIQMISYFTNAHKAKMNLNAWHQGEYPHDHGTEIEIFFPR